jgi:hypothetical protein
VAGIARQAEKQVPIHGDKDVEFSRSERQQVAIHDGGPAHLAGRSSRYVRGYRGRGANRRIRRAELSRGRFNHSRLGFLQESDDVPPRHRGKACEEIVDRLSGFEIVEPFIKPGDDSFDCGDRLAKPQFRPR